LGLVLTWEASFTSLGGGLSGLPAAPAVEVSVGGFGAIVRRGSILGTGLLEFVMFGRYAKLLNAGVC
jgi:hypothetical protein